MVWGIWVFDLGLGFRVFGFQGSSRRLGGSPNPPLATAGRHPHEVRKGTGTAVQPRPGESRWRSGLCTGISLQTATSHPGHTA